MSMSDPIADMLTRIRNAILREHKQVTIPSSKIKENIAKVLAAEGFINDYNVQAAGVGNELVIQLRYDSKGEPVIRSVQRVSKPGLRIFKGAKEIKPLLNGQGIYIISTSNGVMSDAQCRQEMVGGEVMCAVS
ncbi:MAG: 30S ribosomal protein S8 [Deltaproteobacteria bacterium]|jgi:small subunit ribosomal protein S8|nr:30S ribosomal protein S8 [Deltaproteobacteria bacterium]MBT4089442.1 30S ribosomal protein S8 [Deltaproteobacteria bacterium]MBT4266373.1 30S ribosomal protein S8 [Deltaproteobacteria bacterium]MBT4643943.1 30S ribosomal protein S8 [Deltaproteobacteria bacterium]MBT6502105.1 30S ribosomal protein S8 [Deltaproteobacteria bacterium]